MSYTIIYRVLNNDELVEVGDKFDFSEPSSPSDCWERYDSGDRMIGQPSSKTRAVVYRAQVFDKKAIKSSSSNIIKY